MRRVVAGNWKMNHGPAEASGFFRGFDAQRAVEGGVEILVFPPALSFAAAFGSRPGYVQLGVQNVHDQTSGAFTGEVSVGMAEEAGATHVLIGHSERRQLFGETDEWVAAKTESVLNAGLVPVVCVGETLEERRGGKVDDVILRQLSAVIPVFDRFAKADVLVAYEPVWAIGTGETATPQDAADAHATLRRKLTESLGAERGGAIPLLYGGSVKPTNALALMSAPEVDGVLVGGASLKSDDFAAIAEAGAESLSGQNPSGS